MGGRAVHSIKWKARHGGLEVSDARKLKGLEEEKRKLEKRQNGFVEIFIGLLRDEFLNKHLYTSYGHVRVVINAWKIDYNKRRRTLFVLVLETAAGTWGKHVFSRGQFSRITHLTFVTVP